MSGVRPLLLLLLLLRLLVVLPSCIPCHIAPTQSSLQTVPEPLYRISRRQQPYDQHAATRVSLPAFVVQSKLPVADLYLPDTHAVHVRSCADVTTVACVASAGGSSSALKRRVRVRGTGRAGFVRGRTKHPWDRARAKPTVTRGQVDFPAVTNSPENTLAHRHKNNPSQVYNYHQVHSAGTVLRVVKVEVLRIAVAVGATLM